MADNAYTLRVPVAKDHWIVLVSNKEMTPATFAALDRYLTLQKEIVADDESASVDTRRMAETEKGDNGSKS